MNFSPANLEQYHKDPNARHPFYDKSVEMYNALRLHYYGLRPKDDAETTDLIRKRRPGESKEVWQWREDVFEPITKGTLWRVFSSINKIRKNRDWSVKFEAEVPGRIIEEETPEQYLMFRLPKYTSLTNWAFSQMLVQYGLDSNAVVFTYYDITGELKENEYTKPVPTIYNCDQVLDYQIGKYFVLLSKETHPYKVGKRTEQGSVYYTVTPELVQRWVQVSQNGKIEQSHIQANVLGRIPVHFLYGVPVEDTQLHVLSESRLSPMVPFLNEALRQYSDHQATMVQHGHPKFWTYDQQDCTHCKGSTGWVHNPLTGVKTACTHCKGGKVPTNPFDVVGIKPAGTGENPPVTPPMGYVEMNPEVLNIQLKVIEECLFKSLATINFEHVYSTPLNISAVAKAEDKDEANNSTHAFAEDLVHKMDLVAKDAIDIRYGKIVRNEKDRTKLLPTISVPEKFDLTSSTKLVEEIKDLIDSSVDDSIVAAAQEELAEKMFASNPQVKERVKAKQQLDPFAGMSDDSIMTAAAEGVASKEDIYIHFNINALIDIAQEEDKDFFKKPLSERREYLKGKATENLSGIQEREPEEKEPEVDAGT